MFPELEGEFSREDYPPQKRVKLEATEVDNNVWEQELELEYPYGTFSFELFYDKKDKKEDDLELKPIPESEKECFYQILEPKPISMDDLRNMHALEEEENKKREQEARLAQKRLEEEKARLRYEQQQ